MTKRTRPSKSLSANETFDFIEKSVKSAENWREKTHDVFETTQRIEALESLLSIIVELKWRYSDSVHFKFVTTTKNLNRLKTKLLEEVLWDAEVPEPWNRRVLVDEEGSTPMVYIKF